MIHQQTLFKLDPAPQLHLQLVADGDAVIGVEPVERFTGKLAAKQPVAKDGIAGLSVAHHLAHRRRLLGDLQSISLRDHQCGNQRQ